MDFPSPMAYTGLMKRFHPAYVDELVVFSDAFVAARIGMPATVPGGQRAFLLARECSSAIPTDREVERQVATSRDRIMRPWPRSAWPNCTEVRHE